MIRPPVRSALLPVAAAALALAAPLAAQETFELPPPSPTPTPAPAGPADERAGVAIPPRSQPEPTATPVIQPLPSPSASAPPLTLPAPRESTPQAGASAPSPAAGEGAVAPAAVPEGMAPPGEPSASPSGEPQVLPPAAGLPPAAPPASTVGPAADAPSASLPDWWPFAAGGLGLAALLGAGAMLLRRRRKARPLRLAAPAADGPAAAPARQEPPRLDLTLEIIAATRSVIMFTVEYRLTIANRSPRAVNDLNAAVRIACARASAAPPPGAAQGLETMARIGPHQARSVTGTAQIPLSAIAPLRQGQTPLFIPLAHVTLEGEGLTADTRTFVIGTPSPSGRVHPIALDQPPGRIAGLVAQAVAVPPASGATSAAA